MLEENIQSQLGNLINIYKKWSGINIDEIVDALKKIENTIVFYSVIRRFKEYLLYDRNPKTHLHRYKDTTLFLDVRWVTYAHPFKALIKEIEKYEEKAMEWLDAAIYMEFLYSDKAMSVLGKLQTANKIAEKALGKLWHFIWQHPCTSILLISLSANYFLQGVSANAQLTKKEEDALDFYDNNILSPYAEPCFGHATTIPPHNVIDQTPRLSSGIKFSGAFNSEMKMKLSNTLADTVKTISRDVTWVNLRLLENIDFEFIDENNPLFRNNTALAFYTESSRTITLKTSGGELLKPENFYYTLVHELYHFKTHWINANCYFAESNLKQSNAKPFSHEQEFLELQKAIKEDVERVVIRFPLLLKKAANSQLKLHEQKELIELELIARSYQPRIQYVDVSERFTELKSHIDAGEQVELLIPISLGEQRFNVPFFPAHYHYNPLTGKEYCSGYTVPNTTDEPYRKLAMIRDLIVKFDRLRVYKSHGVEASVTEFDAIMEEDSIKEAYTKRNEYHADRRRRLCASR